MPTATGAVMNPAFSGEYPSTNWKYWVSRNVEPNRAKKVSVIVADAAEKRGCAKKRTSSIGCVVVQLPPDEDPEDGDPAGEARRCTCGSLHPCSGASMIAVQQQRRGPTIESTAPTGRAALGGIVGVGDQEPGEHEAMAQSGTLIRNTDPHEKCSSEQAAAERARSTMPSPEHAGPDADRLGPLCAAGTCW